MKALMYKVTRIASGNIVIFENIAEAKEYVELLKEKGIRAILNQWTWQTEIED